MAKTKRLPDPSGFATHKSGSGKGKAHPIYPPKGRKMKVFTQEELRGKSKSRVPKGLKGINFDRGYLTEREVNLLKRRLNDEKIKRSQIPFPDDGSGFPLSDDQNNKGRKWLMNKWKGKSGRVRSTSPFGYREENVLENFQEIRLIDFYPGGSRHYTFHYPYYRVEGSDGSSFEYYVMGGDVHILG